MNYNIKVGPFNSNWEQLPAARLSIQWEWRPYSNTMLASQSKQTYALHEIDQFQSKGIDLQFKGIPADSE